MKKKLAAIIMVIFVMASFVGCGGSEKQVVYVEVPDTSSIVEESTDEEENLTALYASAKPGNIITFGTYEQDNNLANGQEPIEWIVLDNSGDSLFVVSKYILEMMDTRVSDYVYDYKNNYNYKDGITWEWSNIRQWLNDDFISTAFSEEEREYILLTKLSTPNTEEDWPGRYNQHFITYGGKDTEDYLFLLSFEEAEEYLCPLGSSTMIGILTEVGNGDYESWYLRSPGSPYNWEDDFSVTTQGPAGGFRECWNKYWSASNNDWIYLEDGGNAKGALYEKYDNGYIGIHSSKAERGIRPAMHIQLK